MKIKLLFFLIAANGLVQADRTVTVNNQTDGNITVLTDYLTKTGKAPLGGCKYMAGKWERPQDDLQYQLTFVGGLGKHRVTIPDLTGESRGYEYECINLNFPGQNIHFVGAHSFKKVSALLTNNGCYTVSGKAGCYRVEYGCRFPDTWRVHED